MGPFHLSGFPGSSVGKESACNAGDLGLIPGLGRSPGEGKGYPLQYSSLENSIDCSPWGLQESDRTEQLSLSISPQPKLSSQLFSKRCRLPHDRSLQPRPRRSCLQLLCGFPGAQPCHSGRPAHLTSAPKDATYCPQARQMRPPCRYKPEPTSPATPGRPLACAGLPLPSPPGALLASAAPLQSRGCRRHFPAKRR